MQVFQMHVSSVSSAFIHMLQLLHLNVLKADRVLHLLPRFLLSSSVSPPPSRRRLGIHRPVPLFLDAGEVRGSVGPMWACETARQTAVGMVVRTPRPSGCSDASKPHVSWPGGA
jgi:hypothetical protein